jgi:thiamine biosynthesis lipoprotein
MMFLWCIFVFNMILRMKKYFLLLLITVLVSCNSEKETQIVQLEGFVFGTTYHITFLNDSPNTFQKSIDSVFHLMNKSLSTYLPASDISKINSGDTTIFVDALFTEVYQKSKRIYTETNGYFDPTVGNLVNAWGFGPKEAKKNIDSVEVRKMMQLVGFDKTQLLNGKIVKEDASIVFDFNSIAKGFGVDVVGRFLETKNVTNYLVEIGGEIRARGKNIKEQFWTVAIEKPNTDGTQSFQTTIRLENESMATSGNYRKFRITKEGKKYVHTVNPKTGFASESNLLSASVISTSDCADVDAYATAFMAMGLEKTKRFLESNTEIHVVLLFLDAVGTIQEFKNVD